jgi:hypothetical protein
MIYFVVMMKKVWLTKAFKIEEDIGLFLNKLVDHQKVREALDKEYDSVLGL